jgi:hypothetical protein
MYAWLGDPSLEVGKLWTITYQTRVGWCNLQWPEKLAAVQGQETGAAFGQVWVNGVTGNIGQGLGIEAALGFGPAGSDPSAEGWTWAPAGYNTDSGNNDEYMAKLVVPEAGTFAYAFRFKGASDEQWMYCDLDGSQNGVDTSKLGVLTVAGAPVEPDPGVPEADAGP